MWWWKRKAAPKNHEGSTLVIRRNRDDLRPGQVLVVNDVSYRVGRLLVVNHLGAFYEAKAE